MIIRFILSEGTQYKVGSVKFTGNKLFSRGGYRRGAARRARTQPQQSQNRPERIADGRGRYFHSRRADQRYGGGRRISTAPKAIIDVRASSRNLNMVKIPNTEAGTMDLEFQIDEGQKSYIEKIEIHGNIKTKDKVIRRELAVSPGELFDMVRVKLSKQRLEGLGYFDRVDTRPEATDVPNRKNLVVDVDEKTTGHVSFGRGI